MGELFWFGCVLDSIVVLVVLSLVSSAFKSRDRGSNPTVHSQSAHSQFAAQVEHSGMDHWMQECQRLQTELQQQKDQLTHDFRQTTFEQLQTLLTNYPSASKLSEQKPDLPAKNLTSLFTPLATLVADWGYQPIGTVWDMVPYDPQLHQPDSPDIQPGESVYIRFIGYREGDRILCPAKVSRTLPKAIATP